MPLTIVEYFTSVNSDNVVPRKTQLLIEEQATEIISTALLFGRSCLSHPPTCEGAEVGKLDGKFVKLLPLVENSCNNNNDLRPKSCLYPDCRRSLVKSLESFLRMDPRPP